MQGIQHYLCNRNQMLFKFPQASFSHTALTLVVVKQCMIYAPLMSFLQRKPFKINTFSRSPAKLIVMTFNVKNVLWWWVTFLTAVYRQGPEVRAWILLNLITLNICWDMINASLSAGQLKNDTVFQVMQALFSPLHPNSTTHHRISHTHTKDTHVQQAGMVSYCWSHCAVFFGQFFSLLFMFLSINDSFGCFCASPVTWTTKWSTDFVIWGPSLSNTSGCACIRIFNGCQAGQKN